MSDQRDPITELLEALQAGHPPPLAWIARWSENGARDPVESAWECAGSYWSMLGLLDVIDRRLFVRARMRANEFERGLRAGERSGAIVDAVREAVPTPTLEQVLAVVARRA